MVQQRAQSNLPVSLSLHDRTFDLVLLSNWEDQIIYGPSDDVDMQPPAKKDTFTAPVNKALESGIWTQSIIWDTKTPFRDFTQIEHTTEDSLATEDRNGKHSSIHFQDHQAHVRQSRTQSSQKAY